MTIKRLQRLALGILAKRNLRRRRHNKLRHLLSLITSLQNCLPRVRVLVHFDPTARLDLDLMADDDALFHFRFTKAEIYEIMDLLEFPAVFHTSNRLAVPRAEAFCYLLKRLSYPSRLGDHCGLFGRSVDELSRIWTMMTRFMYEGWGQHLYQWVDGLLTPSLLGDYAEAVRDKGAPEGCRVGLFLDGTARRIARPNWGQRTWYSGHKRSHCVKLHGITTPSGYITALHHEAGRHTDAYLLRESGLIDSFREKSLDTNGERVYAYGDCGYGCTGDGLIAPYRDSNDPTEVAFNLAMSKVRISVEWKFGIITTQWSFLDWKKQQKVYLNPVTQEYAIACFLSGLQNSLRPNQISQYFQCPPLSLKEYVAVFSPFRDALGPESDSDN